MHYGHVWVVGGVVVGVAFFVFKQETAYEMRISDWSSDVCSSDLIVNDRAVGELLPAGGGHAFVIPDDLAAAESKLRPGKLDDVQVKIAQDRLAPELGRASCRERVCQYV